jgi:formylglycine-generating enzyme required for sulfatase activity
VPKRIKKYDMEFAYIPAGVFPMGGNDLEHRHSVVLSRGFYMQITPVTQAQWRAVMNTNPSHFKDNLNRPVETVSWGDAQVFIKKLNEREGRKAFALPTEAQWEYACRAGTGTRYYTGDTEADLDRAGWYDGNSDRQTQPVGQKASNDFGLHDMHGNVWEWCADWFGDYPQSAAIDPSGPPSGWYHVLRGGAFLNTAEACRSAHRSRCDPDDRSPYFGFRLVRLPGQPGEPGK